MKTIGIQLMPKARHRLISDHHSSKHNNSQAPQGACFVLVAGIFSDILQALQILHKTQIVAVAMRATLTSLDRLLEIPLNASIYAVYKHQQP